MRTWGAAHRCTWSSLSLRCRKSFAPPSSSPPLSSSSESDTSPALPRTRSLGTFCGAVFTRAGCLCFLLPGAALGAIVARLAVALPPLRFARLAARAVTLPSPSSDRDASSEVSLGASEGGAASDISAAPSESSSASSASSSAPSAAYCIRALVAVGSWLLRTTGIAMCIVRRQCSRLQGPNR